MLEISGMSVAVCRLQKPVTLSYKKAVCIVSLASQMEQELYSLYNEPNIVEDIEIRR